MRTPAAAPRWLAVGAPALVAAVTAAAFLPALGAGFVNWDDAANFVENDGYRGLGWTQVRWAFTNILMGHYIPVTWLTLGLDHVVWGMDPRGYHASSLVFHVLTALAFYFLALRLLRAGLATATEAALRVGAAIAALVFAVHPLRAESVVWLTERRDVVSGLLAMLCLLAYLRHATTAASGRDRRWYLTALVLFLGALLAKVIAVVLAPVLLLLDVYPLRRLGGRRGWGGRWVWLEKAPFFALGIFLSAVAFAAVAARSRLHGLGEMDLTVRLTLSLWSSAFYLEKMFVPLGLSPLYQLPVTLTWTHLAALAAVTGVALLMRRRWPGLLAAWVAYLVMLFPVAGVFHNGPQAAADRYTYLPCMGFAILAGALVARPWAGARVLRGGLAVGIAALAVLTWQQAGVWRDSVSLWRHAVAVRPESRAAHAKLAEAYVERGQIPEAIAHYEETLRLSASKAPYHAIIGWLLASTGARAPAQARFDEALRLASGLPEACAGLIALGDGRPLDARPGCPPPLFLEPGRPSP